MDLKVFKEKNIGEVTLELLGDDTTISLGFVEALELETEGVSLGCFSVYVVNERKGISCLLFLEKENDVCVGKYDISDIKYSEQKLCDGIIEFLLLQDDISDLEKKHLVGSILSMAYQELETTLNFRFPFHHILEMEDYIEERLIRKMANNKVVSLFARI